MILKITLAILQTALVFGAVVLLDDIIHDKLPPYLSVFLPAWVWLLPTRGFMEA